MANRLAVLDSRLRWPAGGSVNPFDVLDGPVGGHTSFHRCERHRRINHGPANDFARAFVDTSCVWQCARRPAEHLAVHERRNKPFVSLVFLDLRLNPEADIVFLHHVYQADHHRFDDIVHSVVIDGRNDADRLEDAGHFFGVGGEPFAAQVLGRRIAPDAQVRPDAVTLQRFDCELVGDGRRIFNYLTRSRRCAILGAFRARYLQHRDRRLIARKLPNSAAQLVVEGTV